MLCTSANPRKPVQPALNIQQGIGITWIGLHPSPRPIVAVREQLLTGARANHESVLYQLRREAEFNAVVVGAPSTLCTACFRNGLLRLSHSRASMISDGVACLMRGDCGSRYNVNALSV